MSTSLEHVQNANALDNMDTLRQSVRNRIGIKEDVEEDGLIYQMLQASRDIKDLLVSSFGPRGQSKIIISPTDDVYLTSDGKTIIEQIDVLHPVVTSLKELAMSMDRVCGDGTKTAVILAASLIENAAKLMAIGLHPTTIIKGYQLALNKAYDILNYESIRISSERDLHSVIENASLGKGIEAHQARIIADIVLKTLSKIRDINGDAHIDLNDYVKVIKKIGTPSIESISGMVLDERPARSDMPYHLENASVLMINGNVKLESKIINSQRNLRIDDLADPMLILHGKERNLRSMSQKIIDSGANLVFCEGDVDESVEGSLAKHGILLFQKLKKRDMEMVSKATGASILSIRDDIMPHNLGFADEAKVEKRNNEHFLFLSVSDQLISTIMIWEPFSYGLEKIEEAVDDAVNNAAFILKNPLVLRGGGDVEFVLSQMLRQYSSTIEGKEQLAVVEYANALEEIPRTLARNVGLNEVDAITKMLNSYNKGIDCRIDFTREVVANNPPVYDSFSIKQMAVIAATEAVSNMLRIDKIVLKKS
ncbi:TCP-1/cpn60 chaperonin family protein [Methanolobus vulcani]|uniref:Molecular chaperone Hsp60 n=1 Tax=Methanolobus vulcani TaxID=38026 RepID=A0A7Z8KNE4_9EURY|nr:TCP-1/cpn60 chaperonin family protein [Methanolobus vulcani]TQD25356.1 molecular chaperone Hsp60 [Methanolobus vulcani]